jgi:hypothetical protein
VIALSEKRQKRILCEGPVDRFNGAQLFRLTQNKRMLVIFPGQLLTVGEEISPAEAELLLNSTTWRFQEVK